LKISDDRKWEERKLFHYFLAAHTNNLKALAVHKTPSHVEKGIHEKRAALSSRWKYMFGNDDVIRTSEVVVGQWWRKDYVVMTSWSWYFSDYMLARK
jgi:hypothetical protein